MSEVKFNPDLFTGSQELNRFQQLMKEKFDLILGYQTRAYGIMKNYINQAGDGNNFKVETNTVNNTDGKIKISNKSYAIDNQNRIIYTDVISDISVPNDNKYYWLKIGYISTSQEVGTVSVSTNGSVVGVGTKFTEVLRGLPDFPTSIKFLNSVNNLQEYQVLSVIDNNNAVIAGNLTAEQNLKYKVAGCFTPGTQISEADKFIYSYDSCVFTFVLENPQGTGAAPVKVSNEFWIARVINNAGVVTIEDRRTEFYKYRWE